MAMHGWKGTQLSQAGRQAGTTQAETQAKAGRQEGGQNGANSCTCLMAGLRRHACCIPA